MTPTEALNLLAEIARRFNGTLDDHQKLQTAVAVLNEEITRTPEPAPESETEEVVKDLAVVAKDAAEALVDA